MKRINYIILLTLLWWICACQSKKSQVPIYALPFSDSMKIILKEANEARSTDLEKSIKLFQYAIEKGKEWQDIQGLITAYRRIVFISSTKLRNTDMAIKYSNEALALGLTLGDANTLCDMYGMRAVIYQVNGNLDSAVYYNKLALKFMDEDDAPDSLKNWPLYLNVADLYSQLGNQKLAIEFTNKYLDDYVLKIQDTNKLISSFNNLSVYYTKSNQPKRSEEYILKAWSLQQQWSKKEYNPELMFSMYSLYFNNGDYKKAEEFNQENYQYFIATQNYPLVYSSFVKKLELLYAQKDIQRLHHLINSTDYINATVFYLSDDVNVPLKDKVRFYEVTYLCYDLLGETNKAYQFLKQTAHLQEELRKQESNNELEQFEIERKRVAQENLVLSKQLQIKDKNNTILALIIGMIIIIALVVILIISIKRKNAAHQNKLAILEKEKEWERKQVQLQTQLNERTRISRELHDDLGASLTSIVMTANAIQPQQPNNNFSLDSIKETAQETIASLNEIVWTLNSKNDSLHGLIAYLRKYAQKFFSKSKISCRLLVEETIPDAVVDSTFRRSFLLCFKECINNVAKHSEATEVVIEFSVHQEQFSIKVKDNGKGIAKEKFEHINGNGLLNLRKNMELINGNVDFDINNGTSILLNASIESRQNTTI